MRGAGGLPAPRVDQQRQPGTPALQPGSTNTVRARFVIISGGAGEGVFVYEGAPALGNPPLAWITDGAVDPYGNVLPVTGPVVAAAGPNGSYAALLPSANASVVPQLVLGPGGAAFLLQQPAVFAGIAGAGTSAERYALNLTSGWTTKTNGAGYVSSFFFQGAAPDGSADGFATLVVGSAAGAPVNMLQVTPENLVAGGPVFARLPLSAPGTPAAWQNMSLQNGWGVTGTQFAQFKLMPDDTVMVRFGGLTPGTTTDATEIWGFPSAAYTPSFTGTMSFPVAVTYTTAPTSVTSTPEVVIRSTGGMQCFNLRGTVGSIAGTFSYPLD